MLSSAVSFFVSTDNQSFFQISCLLIEHGVNSMTFSPNALSCLPSVENTKWEVPKEEIQNRRDLRNSLIFSVVSNILIKLALPCFDVSIYGRQSINFITSFFFLLRTLLVAKILMTPCTQKLWKMGTSKLGFI